MSKELVNTAKDGNVDSAKVAAEKAVQAVIRRHAMEAAWPSMKDGQVKSSIFQMATEIASLFGKTVDDISIEDIGRAQRSVEEVCSRVSLHKVGWRKARGAVDLYNNVSSATELVSHVYWVGSAFYGNFGPVVRKFGLKVGGAPLARATGVWLAGQAISELYFDAARYKPGRDQEQEYFPLFDALTYDQYRELAVYMGIDVRVAWDAHKLREEILADLTKAHHNKVVAMWSEAPPYKTLLLSLAEELGIPDYKVTDSEELLEERVVVRVTAESIDKLSGDQLQRFESVVRSNFGDSYWSESIKSTLFAGGLVAGRLAGARLALVASSGLATLVGSVTSGVGATAAATAATALSTVFGPIGIASAATVAALHWTRARPRKALPFVLYMAAARGILAAESRPLSLWQRVLGWFLRLRVTLGIGPKQ